ncbi:MAG: hypothetical protein HOC91_13460 [Nitrospinaceae bacterium]|jgi:hypothetical protein|nr:hypothetical protein [Nitrospinaceae bacterium]MBT3433664.1 hypothetical protein [Nitrospinaceae bacterium]MBT3823151.1 hypothetical protein [Nitrospinaceae bacterium]MBT4094073.1 hypothetical protein [Nitrospinaceae bacterium]MBT4431515.1 hypothetical protein [Nitrospinaceae bacterium]
MTNSFREQIVERLRLRLAEADLPLETIETAAAEVAYILGRLVDSQAFDAAARQILQRYAEDWAEQSSKRLLETHEEGVADLVHGMTDSQGRTRAVRALKRALMDTLDGVERPPDDMGLIEDDDA